MELGAYIMDCMGSPTGSLGDVYFQEPKARGLYEELWYAVKANDDTSDLSDRCAVCHFTKGQHYHGDGDVLLCPKRPLENGVVSPLMTEFVRDTRTAWTRVLDPKV